MVLGAAVAGAALAGACGSSTAGDSTLGTGGGFPTSGPHATMDGPSGSGGDQFVGSSTGSHMSTGTQGNVQSLEIKPATKTLDVNGGATATQAFTAVAHYADGSQQDVGATWSADGLGIGSIDGTGTFTANGALGGVVDVTAIVDGQTATATLTVVLHVTDNSANADAPTQAALLGATTADASVVWDYPYDGTVFPRGIGAPQLMWDNGGAADVYLVHIKSATFELEAFTSAAPPSRFAFDPALWDQFASSTSGAVELTVARWDGANATVVVDHHDSIAPGSMRGTIYYWAINTGRVMRIQPGASAPDDLFAGVNLVDPSKGACVSCHTAAANGSRVVLNAGHWDTSVDETSVSFDL
ncbi:MAG TPA: hypothetical protein VGM56_31610, partial [Byssovorax sp.]